MKITFLLLSFLSLGLLPASPAWSFGGIVGNGAGLVEQNIFYAYYALPKAIENCLQLTSSCTLNPQDRQVLERISQIASQNSAPSKGIQFVSELQPLLQQLHQQWR